MQTLADLLDRFQEWRNNLPSSLANSVTAEALDAWLLELRGYVEELHGGRAAKGLRAGLTTLTLALRNTFWQSKQYLPLSGPST